jgi:hypothetical protein
MGNRKIDVASATERVIAGLQGDFEFLCHHAAQESSELVESEIELILLTALRMVGHMTSLKFFVGEGVVGPQSIEVIPQYQWNNYRIDFCLRAHGHANPLFIECDGHDFHERTKEQAEHDRSKDRAIQAAGIHILRFTGREIWRDASHVVGEIIKFL